MEGYNVTYRPTEKTTGEVSHLETEDVNLEEICAICQEYQTNAALYGENGEYKGWVHADGNYRLT